MIVRILGEGQFDIAEESLEELNDLDEALVGAVEGDDEEAFRRDLSQLLSAIRAHGAAVPLDHLGPSDLVLPGEDATLQEVRSLLGGEGLIPN